MTLVLAWRDPLCIVSDDAGTNLFGAVESVGPKMARLSEDLVAGASGLVACQPELYARISALLPVPTWTDLGSKVAAIVEDMNSRSRSPWMHTSVVVAGFMGDGTPGIIEYGPDSPGGGAPPEGAPSNPFAALGSAAVAAAVARAVASRRFVDLAGAELLQFVSEVAVETSVGCGKPIWRLDVHGSTAPYRWIT